jgi:hypothetical protein
MSKTEIVYLLQLKEYLPQLILIIPLSLKVLFELIKFLRTYSDDKGIGPFQSKGKKLKEVLDYKDSSPEIKSLYKTELKHENMRKLGITYRRLTLPILKTATELGESFNIDDYKRCQDLLVVEDGGELKLKTGHWETIDRTSAWTLFSIMGLMFLAALPTGVYSLLTSNFSIAQTLLGWAALLFATIYFFEVPTMHKYRAADRVKAQLEDLNKKEESTEEKEDV